MARAIQRYGWKRDLPDHRDRIFNDENVLLPEGRLLATCDLSPKMPPIYDQGQLGSCTGNGWARVMEYMGIVQGEAPVTPSRLFIYYNERVLEGDPVDQDTGAEVRTGAKVVATLGAPPEADWPYDITQFAVKPPQQAYADATKHEALVYQRIVLGGPGAPVRTALTRGLPIVFGFSVPDYFETGWDYTTPLPVPGPDDQIVGGHCVVITGYDYTRSRFPVPALQIDNSWSADWGLSGRFWMDARWFDPRVGLASDLWIVQKVS